MRYPILHTQESSRQMVDIFKGYNHNLRIGDGEFFDMKNMTSDYYPVASPRRERGVYASATNPNGMIAKDSLCYVDGTKFVINEYPVEMGLSDEPKQLVSMGAYVIIMPDKKWINTLDTTEFGNIEAIWESTGDVTFTLCTLTGDNYEGAAASATEPKEPKNMQLWIDISSTPHVLKQYSEAGSMWVSIATTYIKIAATGIGKAFAQYDGVTISGVKAAGLQDLNSSMVIWDRGDDYIVVVGILDELTTQKASEGAITVGRTMPEMDYLTESDNRLWGCKYGMANGQVVNEIYACKLGDFKNWNCFMGISTDSYVAGVGSDGPFTGAVTHLGYPLFFKENIMHKVYGKYPANFQIQDTACRGVQKGCDRSMAIVNETLFYKARSGIMAYDGSLPTEVSYALGTEGYNNAVGGAHGNKYYVSMEDLQGQPNLFVYDTAKDMWHKEDNLRVSAFCSCRGEMYAIDADTKKILTMLGSDGTAKDLQWMVETGEIGISSPDMKYISRLTVRMLLEIGSEVTIYGKYDFSDAWEHLFVTKGTSLRSFSVPIRPKRCDHMRLRIVGKGMAKIYAITKTIEQGSEIS